MLILGYSDKGKEEQRLPQHPGTKMDDRVESRMHLLEGFIVARASLDRLMAVVREAESSAEAVEAILPIELPVPEEDAELLGRNAGDVYVLDAFQVRGFLELRQIRFMKSELQRWRMDYVECHRVLKQRAKKPISTQEISGYQR